MTESRESMPEGGNMANDAPARPSREKVALTELEIERITYEERLRSQLRSEFNQETKEKTSPVWWNFLNSHFGLFVLSSVLLAGRTGLFTQAQSYSRQIELRNQEILKITTELQYRLSTIQRFSRQMIIKNDAGRTVGA